MSAIQGNYMKISIPVDQIQISRYREGWFGCLAETKVVFVAFE